MNKKIKMIEKYTKGKYSRPEEEIKNSESKDINHIIDSNLEKDYIESND